MNMEVGEKLIYGTVGSGMDMRERNRGGMSRGIYVSAPQGQCAEFSRRVP